MVSEKHRRLRRELMSRRQGREERKEPEVAQAREQPKAQRKGLDRLYHDHYKALFIVTMGLLLCSLAVIAFTYAQTGDVIHKGVSLSGGITVTVPTDGAPLDVAQVQQLLHARFPDADFAVREVSDLGTQVAVVIEASPPSQEPAALSAFEEGLLDTLDRVSPGVRGRASTEVIGSSLGESFFQQTAKAVLIAFSLMGLVVFIYFGESKAHKALVVVITIAESLLIWFSQGFVTATLAVLLGAVLVVMYVRFSIPSAAVVLAAISTIIFTIAVVDLLHLRISTAGIAAFLMLIGYSVDTDILLSTRVLKRSEGTVYERIVGSVKTGMTMEACTIAAAGVALIFTQSEVIREIMTIILIGLIADIFFTWIQNAGILRVYLEKHGKGADQ